VEQWALNIIDELNSYTEISQSGTGLHTIVRLTRPLARAGEGGRYRAGRIEMYDSSSPRFFVMTGNVDGIGVKAVRKLDLTTLQKELSRLDPKAQSLPTKSPHSGDQSRDDFALACRLAREFHCDPKKVTEEFRRQAVQREKVTGREDYVRRTVGAAIRTVANADDSSSPIDLLWGYDAGDVGNGQRLLAMHRANILCDDRRGTVWYRWGSKRWQEVSEGVIRELAHQVGIQYVKEAVEWRSPNPNKDLAKTEEDALRKNAMSYLITKVLNNAITEARPYALVKIEDFDSNCDLLNFTNGTLDISSDQPILREHRREDRITRLINFDYDPNATCPEFLRFLITTMGGNPDNAEDTPEQRVAMEMIAYQQQIFGCTLSADVSDKNIFIFNGNTDTGKTTLLATVHGVIPDYTVTIPIEALMMEERNSSIEESLAALRGKRMAITSETSRYHTLNVARIKQITQGNDRAEISVVPKYKPQITFRATHHLFMDCNFRPRIRGGDDATWNRLRILNFPHRVPRDQQIKNMTEILLRERQGIMTWMIQGLVAFRKAGRKLPIVADMETRLKGWRTESERLRDFLDAKCWLESEWTGTVDGAEIILPEDWEWTVAQNELWKCYSDWFKTTQEDDKRMRKAEFYGDIESLPGVRRGRPNFAGKPDTRQQKDGFFGIALRTI
jgi:putative DNA primase/helicase